MISINFAKSSATAGNDGGRALPGSVALPGEGRSEAGGERKRPDRFPGRASRHLGFRGGARQATATGIFPIFACHSFGPVSCTLVPLESTATVTGMSSTSNS